MRELALQGTTERIITPVGTAFITINGDTDGPLEVFINVGKGGSDVQADAEAIGRLCSLVMRLPDGLERGERVKQIINQLRDIGGSRPTPEIKSLSDGVAYALRNWE